MIDPAAIYSGIIDSLDSKIAVIDQEGNIIYVNRAWKEFGRENGLAMTFNSIGCNYLTVCLASAANGDELAADVAQGIHEVISGKRDAFHCEYPCHSPDVRRWFMMRVTPLPNYAGRLLVITHQDITERKLTEERIKFLDCLSPAQTH